VDAPSTILLAVLSGVLLGALLGWLWRGTRGELPAAKARELEVAIGEARGSVAALTARNEELSTRRAALEGDLANERLRASELGSAVARAEEARDALARRLDEERANLEAVQKRLTAEFESLASRLLDEKGGRLLEQNKESLGHLLAPVRERLTAFQARLESIHDQETQATAQLREQLEQIRSLNREMNEEARNLTRALTGQAKFQGTWGELILEKILEKSGLRSGVEYETQAGFTETDGRRRLPDVVIHLPENRHMVIDSKVSLTAYERYSSATTDDGRAAAEREHIRSLRRHLEELSAKDYSHLYGISSPDFVLLFVPVEPALNLAFSADTSLLTDAFDRNVILVSASTLLATLRTVACVWRQENQSRNVLEIARQGGDLYDEFVRFHDALADLGKHLHKTTESYDETVRRLTTGRGNLVRRAETLRKLGAKASKSLPRELAERAAEEDSPDDATLPESGITGPGGIA